MYVAASQSGRSWLLAGKHCVAHGMHLALLLSPTLLLAGLEGVGWDVVCFGIALSAAAVLESTSVSVPSLSSSSVSDRVALRIAWIVGPCLLGSYWLAQVERLVCERDDAVLMYVGAACLASGTALRVAAIRTLGAQFISDVRAGRVFIRDGVYRWTRHPSEVGLLLMALGGSLLLGAPITAITTLTVLLPISLWRMRREDAVWARWQPGD